MANKISSKVNNEINKQSFQAERKSSYCIEDSIINEENNNSPKTYDVEMKTKSGKKEIRLIPIKKYSMIVDDANIYQKGKPYLRCLTFHLKGKK